MREPPHRRSYYKTVIVAALVCVVLAQLEVALLGAASAHRSSTLGWLVWDAAMILDAVAFFASLLVLTGGVISLRRDRREILGQPYDRPQPARHADLEHPE